MPTLRPATGLVDEVVAYYRSAGVLEASGAVASHVLIPWTTRMPWS